MSRPKRYPTKRSQPKVFEVAKKYRYGKKIVMYWGECECDGMFHEHWYEPIFRLVLPDKEIGKEITIPYKDQQKLKEI